MQYRFDQRGILYLTNWQTHFKSYTPCCSPAVVEAIESESDKLEKADIIKPSNSLYSAPTVCVENPGGTLCVTIDLRMVNKNVINDAYPMHKVEDQLDAMSGSSVFTTLNLTKVYNQMCLAEESREISAFLSPKGYFQCRVLPMGMKTSGAIFQRLMDQMLGIYNHAVLSSMLMT